MNIIFCKLCEVVPANSKHHIIPKSLNGKEIELVCVECHKQIHSVLTNKQLRKDYYNIEELKKFEEIQKWIKWRKKHPEVSVKHKMSNYRKQWSKYS